MSDAGCKRGPWSPLGEASGCGPLERSILRGEEGQKGGGEPLPTRALCLGLRPVGVHRSSVHFPLAVKSWCVWTPVENGGVLIWGLWGSLGESATPRGAHKMSQDLPAPGRGPQLSEGLGEPTHL